MASPSILERERSAAETPTLRPLNDYVYVRQDKIPDKQGRFWLPDSARVHKATRYGTVLAVGPGRLVCYEHEPTESERGLLVFCEQVSLGAKSFGRDGMPELTDGSMSKDWEGKWWITKRLPMSVAPGDRVAFADFAGNCVGLETDPSLLLMREEEILCKVLE